MTPSMQKLIESRWYREGVEARNSASLSEANPYGGGSPKALLWDAGFYSVDDDSKPAPATLEEGEMVV